MDDYFLGEFLVDLAEMYAWSDFPSKEPPPSPQKFFAKDSKDSGTEMAQRIFTKGAKKLSNQDKEIAEILKTQLAEELPDIYSNLYRLPKGSEESGLSSAPVPVPRG
jgi:hypothetical protein